MKVNWPIAWNATHNLLLTIGVVALFAYVSTLHYYLIVPSVFFLGVLWYLLYRFELGYRTRRFEGFRYN